MKILLDVGVPIQLRRELPDHDVWTAVRMSWGKLENGELLSAAEKSGFELIIICDKNMRYQQNLTGRTIAILELWTNHRPTLEIHWSAIRAAVDSIHPKEYKTLPAP